MQELKGLEGTRFSGAEWADQLEEVLLVGAGGIGSWLAVNLARIGHQLFVMDGDAVDETNATGGQMFSREHIGRYKTSVVAETCRRYGAVNHVYAIESFFGSDESVALPITITGLDSMAARRLVFDSWVSVGNALSPEERKRMLFIDGRLTLEMYEVFTIHHVPEQIDYYREHDLFSDEEASAVACNIKQSTFSAMGIGSLMTAVLSNHLTNLKHKMGTRAVSYYQRMHLPTLTHTVKEVGETDTYYEEGEDTLREEILSHEGEPTADIGIATIE